jgi:predicted acyltransferase
MNQRYYSLDVFRGATVALMIMVNNPGSWGHIFPPLDHSPWHGCTPTDLVFPFFLFAVGNAMSFVMPKFEKEGTAYFLKKVVKRTVLIILIGLFLNWSPFIKWDNNQIVFKTFEKIRIMGVLQRIALCYFFGSVIVYFFKTRGAYVISCCILLLYWIMCLFLGNSADPYSLQGFWGTQFDINLFGINHVYKGEGVPFDPEGLSSTFAAIVQVVFGYFVGQYIQQKGKNYEMLSNLFIAGIVLLFTGYCWDMVFPINKKIWTSSYTIYTTGLATITIAIMIYLIEFKEAKGNLSKFFDVFGKNPLFIFFLSGFLPRLLALIRIDNGLNAEGKQQFLTPFGWFYENVCKNISTDLRVGSLVYALIMILFYWSIVYVLDRKKIYIKV